MSTSDRRNPRWSTLTGGVVILVTAQLISSAVFAYPRPGRLERASGIDADGVKIRSQAVDSSLSADGRVVAFTTDAPLVPLDDNGLTDIYVRDLSRGRTELITKSFVGGAATGIGTEAPTGRGWFTGFPPQSMLSWSPAVSGNGRYVAFVSRALDLVSGVDKDLFADVFVADRKDDSIERVSLQNNEEQLQCDPLLVNPQVDMCAEHPSIDHDGDVVSFTSRARGLLDIVAGAVPLEFAPPAQILVRNLKKGTTSLVTLALDGEASVCSRLDQVACVNEVPASSVSGDGRFVAFSSAASDLVESDRNLVSDVFVRDLRKKVTERVSVASDGSEGVDGPRSKPFTLQTGSHLSGRDWSYPVGRSMSFDGRYVAFSSRADNLVPYDSHRDLVAGDGGNDVFVHDRKTGRTERISVEANGAEVNSPAMNYGEAITPAISPDGRYVAYFCRCTLAEGSFLVNATNPRITRKVVVLDRVTGQVDPVISFDPKLVGAKDSTIIEMDPDISRLARYISYSYNDTNSTFGPGNSRYPTTIYAWDRGPALGAGVRTGATRPTGAGAFVQVRDEGDDSLGPYGGAEIIGATLAHRPAYDDLYLKLDLDRLAGTRLGSPLGSPTVGDPGLVYGFRLTAGDARYELRAASIGGPARPAAAAFGLFRCDPTCALVESLHGGFGTVGENVVIALPLTAGQGLTASIEDVEAFAALGSYVSGPLVPLDTLMIGAGPGRRPS